MDQLMSSSKCLSSSDPECPSSSFYTEVAKLFLPHCVCLFLPRAFISLMKGSSGSFISHSRHSRVQNNSNSKVSEVGSGKQQLELRRVYVIVVHYKALSTLITEYISPYILIDPCFRQLPLFGQERYPVNLCGTQNLLRNINHFYTGVVE